MFSLIIILVLPWLPVTQLFCNLEIRRALNFEDKYARDTDLIIGGLFTIDRGVEELETAWSKYKAITCLSMNNEFQGYVQALIFLFAIDNINKNPDILPNITLGYHLYDSCLDGRLAVKDTLCLLSGPHKVKPNYSCASRGQLAGIIGDHHSSTTIPVAQILGLYGYAQISYGASDPSLSDRLLYPHVFRMVQNNHIHNMAISELLEHFGWTWVGIIVSDDDNGENELQVLTKYMRERGICAAFTETLPQGNYKYNEKILHVLNNSQITIIIMCGFFGLDIFFFGLIYHSVLLHKTLILPPSWISGSFALDHSIFNGSLAVEFPSQPIPGLEYFVKTCKKHPNSHRYIFLWKSLDELLRNNDEDFFTSINIDNGEEHNGSYSKPNMRYSLLSGVSSRVYSAVEVLGKALHEMFLFMKDKYEENSVTGFIHYRQKLQRYIQMMKSSPDPMRPLYYFNEQGEAAHPYKINNLYIDKDIHEVEIGNFTPWAVSGEKLYINLQSITWKHNGSKKPHIVHVIAGPFTRDNYRANKHLAVVPRTIVPVLSNMSDNHSVNGGRVLWRSLPVAGLHSLQRASRSKIEPLLFTRSEKLLASHLVLVSSNEATSDY